MSSSESVSHAGCEVPGFRHHLRRASSDQQKDKSPHARFFSYHTLLECSLVIDKWKEDPELCSHWLFIMHYNLWQPVVGWLTQPVVGWLTQPVVGWLTQQDMCCSQFIGCNSDPSLAYWLVVAHVWHIAWHIALHIALGLLPDKCYLRHGRTTASHIAA